ncbi:MAG: MarC family protein [Puniceicoccales bacterium]|jgi:multiple antibiotic resistance protein|nr:MarC family protein [Puniceicoccales bacterium]
MGKMQIASIVVGLVGSCVEGGCSFFVNGFYQLFAAVCPLAVIALYLSMTTSYTFKERLGTARTACWIAWSVMLLAALGGPKALAAVGISMEAFNIGGGLLLVFVGFGMLRAEDPEIAMSQNEAEEIGHLSKKTHQDVAIAPLAVPIIAGPGSLTIIIANRAANGGTLELVSCLLAISAVVFLIYVLLVLTSKGAKWLTPTILKLGFRLSGLFLVALGVQFVMNGLRETGLCSSSYVIASLLNF